jgi:fatty-acyl-CoA synthase
LARIDLSVTSELDLAELITFLGTDPATRARVFIMNREDGGGTTEYTYADLYEKSLEYANAIARLRDELDKPGGDRFHVGVFMQNRPEFFYVLGGCAFTNSTLVGINNAQVGEKLAFDVNNIDVDVLIADSAAQPGTRGTFVTTVLEARSAFGFDKLTRDHIFTEGKTGEDVPTVASLLARCGDSLSAFEAAPLDDRQPGIIIFTSGTTGAPKGIEVTWKKLIDTGITGTEILDYTEDDVGYICMPLNHSNSLYLNVMPALMNGAKIMLRRRFSSSNFIRDITESATTVWNSVGDPVHYVLNYLEQKYERPDFSDLPIRTVISTGANSFDRNAFTRIFGLDVFTEIYGSTEAGAVTAVDRESPDYSVGRLIKDVRVLAEGTAVEAAGAVIDPSGGIANLEEAAGEVVVSQKSLGSSAFTGYYKLLEESDKRIVSLEGEEFFRMGDLGAIAEHGGQKHLVFLGRTGDWVRFKGENWSPVDAEKIVMKHPCVRNAGIIGVPQPVGKEDDPMYVVEPADIEAFDVVDLVEYCSDNLPHYMQPRFIRVMGALPMTNTMKVIKGDLRYDFICRTPELDACSSDLLYEVTDGEAVAFTTDDFTGEMERYRDPTNRDRLRAFTRRDDLFED